MRLWCLMVIMSGFHPDGPGSTPGRRSKLQSY